MDLRRSLRQESAERKAKCSLGLLVALGAAVRRIKKGPAFCRAYLCLAWDTPSRTFGNLDAILGELKAFGMKE